MKVQTRVVIIGGGIFGASVAYHLAKAGCTDVVLVDKGELTSGTTFHSVGLVSQFRTSPSLMKVMNYTIKLFNNLKEEVGDALGWHTVGSLRLASSKERLRGLQREVSKARAIGINAEIVSPSEAREIAPFISDQGLYGAVWVPDDGHIDPSSITYELARQAKSLGVEVNTRVRVTDIGVSPAGQVTKVVTDHGEIRTECVVNAAGEWAPRIGAMVGVNIPMVPLMHQYLTTKPIQGHVLPRNTPVVRDPDRLFYCREDVGAFLIGAFETNPKAWSIQGVPWSFTQELLSAEWELFEPVMAMAIDRIPILAEAEVVELINGPDAFTPDGHYALGPIPGLKGFFVAAGGSINGIAGAGGVGKLLAEWILEGSTSIDTHEMNVRRFGPHLANLDYLTEHCREVYRYYYHIRFPNDENEWGRPLRTSPIYSRLKELGAVFGEKNGWERVNYFDPGRPWRQAGADQKRWGWGRPEFFDRVKEEVTAARKQVALLDMTSFGKIDVKGPGAMALLQRLAAGNVEKPVGGLTYTQFLNEKGGIESDVTICRMDHDRFRIVSGTAFVANDIGWIRMHKPEDGSVDVVDVTDLYGCLSLCGPEARRVLQSVTGDDVSNAGFPYMTARSIQIKGFPVWAQRISYTGELGWELYMPIADGPGVWDALMEAGRANGIRPIGYKALDSLRIEKGYLYWSGDITPEDNPLAAGLEFLVSFDKGDFIGRKALSEIRQSIPHTRLRALILDSNHRLCGGESVYSGDRLLDRIRSAAFGHTVGKDIGLVYLPMELGKPGTMLAVEIMGERLQAEVAALPIVDPKGERIRA
jgi:4-methylaminobutanoate oxidase (formaldehyde-forming)